MRRIVPIFSLAIFCTFIPGCGRGFSRDVLATVLSMRGQAAWAKAERNDFAPVTSRTKFGAGSIVRTFQDSRLNLALIPAALVQISSNSELTIETLRLIKDGNDTEDGMRDRVLRIQLNQGKINLLFQRRDDSDMHFTIRTRHAAISADDSCLFQVQEEEAKTRVTCVRGRIYVSQADHETVIEAGYFQEWPSSIAAAGSAADDRQGQTDTSEALGAERELQSLQSGQRLRLPLGSE